MFIYDDLDVQRELAKIPAEYEDVFREALDGELRELGDDRTDADVLRYLRRRREEFRRGGFIRPDGRSAVVVADVEALYEQGVLGQPPAAGDEEAARERRRTLITVGGLLLLAALFLFFIFRGRAQRQAIAEAEETPAPAAEGAATATPALPELAGADDALQTVGGLGAALTIGRPSAIELRYARTEEVIALAIDPSRASPRGELRYNAVTMASANPVAVWLFGTVVNYGIGLPDGLVRNLQPGDRIRLNTDTGASLAFVVTETRQAASHETAAVLSQDRPGMTLFALPAAADDEVALALASYDAAAEAWPEQAAYEMGERFTLAGQGAVQVDAARYENTAEGALRIVIEGKIHDPPETGQGDGLLLSLSSRQDQTPAVPIEPAGDGAWQATFALAPASVGLPLFAELRSLPGGGLAVVRLGEAPDLREALDVEVVEAYAEPDGRAVLALRLHNPGQGAVYLGRDFIQIVHEGGDAYEAAGPVGFAPALPTLIDGDQTLTMQVTFPTSFLVAEDAGQPEDARRPPLQIQIGADLWEVTFPEGNAGQARPGATPTDRQP